MLKIRINPSIDVQRDLLQQLHAIDNQIGDMDRVMQQLGGLSGMDGVLVALRRERDKLEYSRRMLDRMAQCMEKVILYYNSCEDRNCDYAQQETVIYRRHMIGTSSLGNVSDLLRSMV